jgi:hypothetical protein
MPPRAASSERPDVAAISVVVATCDRAESLRSLLQALGHLTHPVFEVVVVKGPCDDETPRVLEEFAGRIKVVSCPDRNVSRARNLGILASAAELIAFIDDDSVPGSAWLTDLAAALVDPDVGGAGGPVYAPDGFGFEGRFTVSDRLGESRFTLERPLAGPFARGADPFPYLAGGNACYRRTVLDSVGLFDESFAYGYDEVDLCARLVDRGVRLEQLDAAPVVHGQLPNATRDRDRVRRDPGPLLETRAIFALRHSSGTRGEDRVRCDLVRKRDEVVDWGRMALVEGRLSGQAFDEFARSAAAGLARGVEIAARGPQLAETVGFSAEPFLPFLPKRRTATRVCVVADEREAERRAAAGEEVHLVTTGADISSLTWRDGMWIHALADNPRGALDRARVLSPEATRELESALSVWHETRRIARFGPLDATVAGPGASAALVCGPDDGSPPADRLASTIEQMGLSGAAEAQQIAAQLLDPRAHPVDWPRAVVGLADLSNAAFIKALYTMLIGRPPSLVASIRYRGVLFSRGRAALVSRLARSDAALRRNGPPWWVAGDPAPSRAPGKAGQIARGAARGVLRATFDLARRTRLYRP